MNGHASSGSLTPAEAREARGDAPGVLILNRVSFIGGLERYIIVAMEQVSRRGFRPYLACPPEGALPDAARAKGLTVLPCEFSRMKSTLHPRKLMAYAASARAESAHVERLCREHDIRILHIHSPVGAFYAARTVRRLGLPMVMHFHEAGVPKWSYTLASRYAARVSSHLLCVSEACRAMVRRMGLPMDRTRVIYNGINPDFLRHEPRPAPEVDGPGPHIGVFGVIWALKGQHIFLEAARRVARNHPTARFYIVGAIGYEEQRAYLKNLHALAEHPDLAGRVMFAGYRSNVADWMAAMDIVALPSVEPESFGNVLVEAMSLGRRVIGTSIGGALEIIRDGETGRLVPPGDPEALAGAMESLIALGPDDTMGQRAAADVRARFSPERFGDEIAALYREMLAGAPAPGKAGR